MNEPNVRIGTVLELLKLCRFQPTSAADAGKELGIRDDKVRTIMTEMEAQGLLTSQQRARPQMDDGGLLRGGTMPAEYSLSPVWGGKA
jgi:hypothetical protein